MAHRALKPQYTAALRGRRLLRLLAITLVSTVALLIFLDHRGHFGYRGDDWARFNGKPATILRITPACTLIISENHQETEVRLLGIRPSDDLNLHRYLTDFTGKPIVLRLEPLEPRDQSGRLNAYVYLSESECLNVNVVHEGLARVDRSFKHSMLAAMSGVEADARKHSRGIWHDAK